MTVIATAAIKVTAEIGDLKNKLDDGSKHLRNFGDAHGDVIRNANGHTLALGRIERALGSYVGHVIGANHVTEQLSVALGSFSAGGVVVTGVLLGITAIVGAYELLTSAAKKAAEEQKKLSDALAQQFLPKTGPRSTTNLEFEAAIKRRAELTRHLGFLENSSNDAEVAKAYISNGEAVPFMSRDKELASVKAELAKVQQGITDAYNGSISAMQTVTVSAKDLAAEGMKAQAELERYNALMRSLDGRFPVSTFEMTSAQKKAYQVESPYNARVRQYEFGVNLNDSIAKDTTALNAPTISLSDGLTREQIKTRDRIVNSADRNAQLLKDTIANTAAQTAQIIGQALQTFGNGSRGAALGGAIGGSIGGGIGGYLGGLAAASVGGIAGAAIGSVVPVVGTIIGGFLGSAIGGLFGHHKKSVDANTKAVNQLTQAMLLNAPSGFRVERYRYSASDPAPLDALGRYVRANASRGGANPLLVAA